MISRRTTEEARPWAAASRAICRCIRAASQCSGKVGSWGACSAAGVGTGEGIQPSLIGGSRCARLRMSVDISKCPARVGILDTPVKWPEATVKRARHSVGSHSQHVNLACPSVVPRCALGPHQGANCKIDQDGRPAFERTAGSLPPKDPAIGSTMGRRRDGFPSRPGDRCPRAPRMARSSSRCAVVRRIEREDRRRAGRTVGGFVARSSGA